MFSVLHRPRSARPFVAQCKPMRALKDDALRVSDPAPTQEGIRMVDDREVRRLVTLEAAIPAVLTAMTALSEGRLEQADRQLLGGGSLVMTAHDSFTGSTVVKLWSGHRGSAWGTLLWDDPRGRLVAGAGAITALRTGAIVGAATDKLAAPQARRLGTLGAGHLALDQVRAVCAVRPIERMKVWSRQPAHALAFAQQVREDMPHLAVQVVVTTREAVREADVVCCATPATKPLFRLEDLMPEVHVNAVGSFRERMHELPQALLAGARQVVVDQKSACLRESGEIIRAVGSGAMDADDLVELGTLRTSSFGRRRTVFKSVGVAAQDWAIGKLLADLTLAAPPRRD